MKSDNYFIYRKKMLPCLTIYYILLLLFFFTNIFKNLHHFSMPLPVKKRIIRISLSNYIINQYDKTIQYVKM